MSLISLHHYTLVRRGAGAMQRRGEGDLQRGLQRKQGCAPQITLQPLMESGPPLLESASCSASDTSPPWTLLVMIGFSYRA